LFELVVHGNSVCSTAGTAGLSPLVLQCFHPSADGQRRTRGRKSLRYMRPNENSRMPTTRADDRPGGTMNRARHAWRNSLGLVAHANIEGRVFDALAYRGPVEVLHNIELVGDATRLNYRMHNKLYVVDNEIGIIGGRNIGDAYFQEGRDLEFGDYDVIAAGGI